MTLACVKLTKLSLHLSSQLEHLVTDAPNNDGLEFIAPLAFLDPQTKEEAQGPLGNPADKVSKDISICIPF